MTTGQPQELAQSLSVEVEAFFHTITRTDAFDKFVHARLMRECDRLQKIDVVTASLFKALLASSTGNVDAMNQWFANAERNGGTERVFVERMRHYVNHGYASNALDMASRAFALRAGMPIMVIATMVASIGAFNAIVQAVDASRARSEVLHMTPLLDVAKRASVVVRQLGVADADIAAMMDVAGEMLRVEKFLWQNDCIDIVVLEPSRGGPALSLAYRIDVPAHQAAAMGWTLTEELMRRGLIRPGISVGFLGTALATPQAA